MKKSNMIVTLVILIVVCIPLSLSASMVETETVTTWNKVISLEGPGTIVKNFEMIKDKVITKYTVKVRKRSYFWETLNADPFLPSCEEWTVKDRFELAAFQADWPKPVVEGLLAQVKLHMDTKGKEGSKIREMKEGDILDWIYFGGVKGNTITLDVGEIVVMVEKYYAYYGSLSKVRYLKEDDKIQAISFEFQYKGIMYVLLWVEGTLRGIEECGNLAGMSHKIPTTK